MSNKEKIEVVLSLYKDAIKSYEFKAHYMNDKPFEQGFDRRLMSDKTSSLYDAVRSLFLELRLSQASRYIAVWEKAYIIGGWCADNDRQRYESLVAVGQSFTKECKQIAAECCDDDVHPQGEQPQGGGGIDHQNKVQQKKTQTEAQVLQLPELPDTLNTDTAREVFGRAIEKGLIKVQGDAYKRNGISKAQLAYMLQRIYLPDATGADGKQFPETALNGLFDESRLGEALRKLADNKNTNGKPRGYQVIDGLFKINEDGKRG